MINLSPLGFGPSSDWNPRETSENFGLRTLVSVSLTLFLDISIKASFGITIVTNEWNSFLCFLLFLFLPFLLCAGQYLKLSVRRGWKEIILVTRMFYESRILNACRSAHFLKIIYPVKLYIHNNIKRNMCLWCYIKYIKCSFFRSFYHPTDHQFSFLFFVRFGTSTYLGSRRESRNLDSNFHLIRVKFPPPFV